MVTLACVAAGMHRGQVYVDQAATDHICTAVNTPVNCWTHGGVFRAVQFTAPTTSLSFGDALPASSTAPTAYAALFDTNFDAYDSAHCVTEYPLDTDKNKRAACQIERVPKIWENPNSYNYRRLYSLSGGVHVWYLLWISLWVGASFSVAFLPATLSPLPLHEDRIKAEQKRSWLLDTIKLPMMLIWHLLGIVLSAWFYVDDTYFNMRLPLNNVIFGVVLQLAALVVQLMWARISQETDIEPNKLATALHNTVYERVPTAPVGLSAMMTLNSMTPVRSTVSKQRLGDRFSIEIFSAKYLDMSLLETFFIEVAITLPPAMVAVYCMCSHVNMDWMLQSIYVRSLFAFLCVAVAYKVLPALERHKQAEEKMRKQGIDVVNMFGRFELIIVLVVLVLTTTVFIFGLLYDWITPVHDAVVFWGDAYSSGVQGLAIYTLVLVVIFIAGYVIALVVAMILAMCMGPSATEHAITHNMHLYGWYMSQMLLFVFRVILFAYAVDPKLWYVAYNKQDVMLNYPSLTYAT
jgi:hypothetical protein